MEEKLIEVKKLFDQGLGARKIAEQLNITRWTVQQFYKELGIYNIGRTKPKTAYLATEKICKKCQTTKSVEQFRTRIKNDRISYEVYCLECEKQYNKENCKQRYQERKANGRTIEYRQNNLDKLRQASRKYNKEHKQELKLKRIKNSSWQEYLKIYNRNRRKVDPAFKIRSIFSNTVYKALRRKGFIKQNSFLKNVSYTMIELMKHLEKQFEPWMTWENHGRYISKTWKDQDPSTWTWQIDHIIPASTLPYTSMTDINFQKCWALENLRPLNAKQNLLDGTNRIRHK